MKYLRSFLFTMVPAAAILACSASGAHNTSASGQTGSGSGSGGAGAGCSACVVDTDCAMGSKCGQFGGDQYCAPDCSASPTCASDRMCTQVSGANGSQLDLCVPNTNVCGVNPGTGGATAASSSSSGAASSSSSAASSSSGNPEICGSLRGPDITAPCSSCKTSGKTCQANGCYGGWWCNVGSNSCQMPPAPSSCGGGTSSSSSSGTTSTSSSSSSSGTTSSGGPIGPSGGTIPTLSFAIVGDTRPANDNDTAHYPTAVITKIWQEIEGHSPRPAFGVTTGDYMFAYASGSESGPQLDLYLGARANFTNIVFPALGNHECTGAVTSNCGPGNQDGTTANYNSFMTKMLGPLGQSKPYYTINVNGTGNAWSAKFVFVACNAWDSTQSSWLSTELSKPTKYTFVVRHEGSIANTGPCVTPSGSIIAQHPLTLLIVGHTHTFSYYPSEKQIVVGNGGAPLTGNVNYGYVIAEQQPNGTLTLNEYDYSTNASQQTITVAP